MPHLTARELHEFAAQAFAETYGNATVDAEALGRFPAWKHLTSKNRDAYERMAALLNEKLAPPEQLVATGKLTDVDDFIVILATGTPEDTEQTVRLKAHDALYNSGLGDGTRDMLRGTLVIQSTHEFLCEPLPQPHSTPYKPEMEMK